ncbi:MAG: hypothetical protein GY715_21760 [Planctomycetes bacterium]|nr:hypothetical protein [Planctomycetota bacterium]
MPLRHVLVPIAFVVLATLTGCAARQEVYVMGMIHGRHTDSDRYGIAQIKDAIRRLQPDYVLCEIPPDRLAVALAEFDEDREVDEPRVSHFPEYTDALFPLTGELRFEIVPCAAWTMEMSDRRRARLHEFEISRPDDFRAYREAIDLAEERIREGGADDDPRWIHTDAYDQIVRTGLEPYDRLFNDDLGPGGWSNINAAHYALIAAALDAHTGERTRVLIMFGAWHKYWFRDRLRERADVVLRNPFP